jgi:hypothetical protein
MMQLSIQKFSSNVVEKLFTFAPTEFKTLFISELIESDNMAALVNSSYGHYVVKRALQLAEPLQVRLLLRALQSSMGQLPSRRLRAKWEKVVAAGSERLSEPRCGAVVFDATTATAAMAPQEQPSRLQQQQRRRRRQTQQQ